MTCPLLCAATSPLAQAKDDEFCRFDGGKADVDEELAAIAHVGRVQFLIALDEEGFFRRATEEHAIAPRAREEGRHVALDPRPQVGVVRLEDYPLQTLFQRLLDVVEEAAHIDVTPGRVAAQRARAPDAQTAPGERANAVDAFRNERVLLAFCYLRDGFQ